MKSLEQIKYIDPRYQTRPQDMEPQSRAQHRRNHNIEWRKVPLKAQQYAYLRRRELGISTIELCRALNVTDFTVYKKLLGYIPMFFDELAVMLKLFERRRQELELNGEPANRLPEDLSKVSPQSVDPVLRGSLRVRKIFPCEPIPDEEVYLLRSKVYGLGLNIITLAEELNLRPCTVKDKLCGRKPVFRDEAEVLYRLTQSKEAEAE